MTEQKTKAAAEPPLDCLVRGRGMRAWIIEGPTGVMLPSACGRTKKEAIANLIGWCDWLLFPTWGVLRKEGFRAVMVEITKKPSNASGKPTAANEPNEG